jgi:hypothetical protein
MREGRLGVRERPREEAKRTSREGGGQEERRSRRREEAEAGAGRVGGTWGILDGEILKKSDVEFG